MHNGVKMILILMQTIYYKATTLLKYKLRHNKMLYQKNQMISLFLLLKVLIH